jgi:hypothetical protein
MHRVREEKQSYRRFLEDIREWYGEKLYEKPSSSMKALIFIHNSRHLKGARDPVESIERFLTYDKMREVLADLWKNGFVTLDIYYAEEIGQGEESWFVDVFQDELNDSCNLNWTWTVITRRELEKEGEKEDELPEWEIVVDDPFSDAVVCKAVEKWLRDRNYEFGVRMIPFDQAKGSGLIKKLRERKNEKRIRKSKRIGK